MFSAYESAFAAAVVEEGDSDEDDLSKMDMGDRARKRIKPWHFESDEAYSKFTETMEATPKYTSVRTSIRLDLATHIFHLTGQRINLVSR